MVHKRFDSVLVVLEYAIVLYVTFRLLAAVLYHITSVRPILHELQCLRHAIRSQQPNIRAVPDDDMKSQVKPA